MAATVYSLTHPIQLKQWQYQSVLFHAPSHATMLLTPVMANALTEIMKSPKNIEQLVIDLHPESNLEQKQLIEHLTDGLTSLVIEGIVQAQ